MRLLKFAARRIVVALPQLVGISIVTFWIIRLLPGDPAQGLAGPYPTPSIVAAIRARLGLAKPMWVQYWLYVRGLVHGNLGTSWFTSEPVATTLVRIFPATFELVTAAVILILTIGITLGIIGALRPRGVVARATNLYGTLAGAFPDFWLGLVLAFGFYYVLHFAPAPVGQLSIGVAAPPRVTGMYVVDSLLGGDWSTFVNALGHLVLPVVTLVLAYMGAVVKLTRASVTEMLGSDHCRFARASGLPSSQVVRYAVRSSLPELITLVGITYTYLLAGDVLVENVFSWGGLGSYIVQAVDNSDYFPIQAFVLLAAAFNLLVYLLVDIAQVVIDPRVKA